MEGWTKVGEVLKCAFCSAVIADAAAPEPETEKASRAAERLNGQVLLPRQSDPASVRPALRSRRARRESDGRLRPIPVPLIVPDPLSRTPSGISSSEEGMRE